MDDDENNLSLMEAYLIMDYNNLLMARSGEEALEKVNTNSIDLIILDIMMPGISGYEVCEKIRSDNRLPYVKILLLSAKNFLDDRLEGYKVGANDYITKPFDPEEVKAKINIFLQLKYANEVIRIKDDLLTLLSHEKNTPLNCILGFADLLKQSKNLSTEDKNYVDYILDSAKDLQNNTRKTLLLCQLKEEFEISPIEANLHHLVKNVIKHFEKLVKEKSITFNFCDSAPDTMLLLDPILIGEAISCIIENAINYSFPGGTISIDFQYTDTHCLLNIIDEGEGIKIEHIDDIFNALFNKDVMRHTKGMGISLALSKAAVELHSGKITAEQNSPAGAIFKIKLPLQANQEANS